jgi:hypothetical protein
MRISALSLLRVLLFAILPWGLVPQLSAITLSPTNPTLKEGVFQQFTSSTPAYWSTTCNTISSSGVLNTGLYPKNCTVTAKAKNGSGNVSTTVHIVSPIVMTPVSASTPQGKTQQFNTSAPVNWTVHCGTMSASGLFTATAAVGSNCGIHGVAKTGTAYNVYGWDITTAPTGGSITISPIKPSLTEGAKQQFTASVPATWTASCGTISSTGAYTAPLTPGSCTVTAKATSGGQTASTVATVSSPITITPSTASTPQGSTQQFSANLPVSWTASCGTISASGLFSASAAAGSKCSIQATATGSIAYTGFASDTIGIAGSFTITPGSISLNEGASQTFISSIPATWTASCGSIDANAGTYSAPLQAGSCTVTAQATSTSQTASAAVTVTSPFTITPQSAALHAMGRQSFAASIPVTWSASCGAFSSGSSNYIAPSSSGTCTITATASSGTAYTNQATVNVDVVNYTSWKNGSGNAGVQWDETLLTPTNVNSTSFGQAWSASVDGAVWAQPLYRNGLVINGSPHNVVYVATTNDSVYAFDGDSGAQLWKTSFLSSGVTAVTGTTVNSTMSQLGVLSTPVMDPSSSTLYVVAETAEQGATYFPHRLHALDLATGQEKLGGPVLISDANLAPIHKLQRPGLLLANGTVYVGFGSIGDRAPYHGLLFAFDENTLAQKALWNATPTGSEGALWMSMAAPAADNNGNIYVVTGNGTFDGTNNFSESVVKLSPSLQLLDYFTPYNQATLDSTDLDLGSANVVVVPDQTGPFPHELISCGKPTPIYVINRDAMGHFGSSSDNIIQVLDHAVGGTSTTFLSAKPCFSTPAVWGEKVYFVANGDVVKQFSIDTTTGKLSPGSQGTHAYGYPGAQPVLSANGASNGLLWTIDHVANTLRADDATNVGNTLYVSPALPIGGIKWTTPTVVNGHVYVGAGGTVLAFTLK